MPKPTGNSKKDVNRQILRLAWPNILTNISVPLIGSVDTALMGHLSVNHLAAIGLSTMIFNFLYWNAGFLRMGTTGMTAQAFGRGDEAALDEIFVKGINLAVMIGLLLFFFKGPIIDLSIYLIQVPEDLIELVRLYFSIRIWDAPATLMLYAILGWFFGCQNARTPMILTILINVINISLSWYLVKGLGWEIEGVAIGTLVAQYLGVIIGLSLIIFKRPSIKRAFIALKLRFSGYRDFLQINANIFVRSLFLSLAFVFFNAESARFGIEILAANVIFLQFINWMSYGIDGFAFASESVIGKYHGRNDEQALNVVLRSVFLFGLGVALLYALVYGIFGDYFYQLFNNTSIGPEKSTVLLWVVITPLVAFGSYIWDGIFIGLTASKAMRQSMMLSFLIYLLAHYLLISYWDKQSGALLALNVFLLARALIQWAMFYRKRWKI